MTPITQSGSSSCTVKSSAYEETNPQNLIIVITVERTCP
jgi:hypothetical protein